MENGKTHWRTFHPTNYIGAYAFDEGEEKILTIALAGHERVEAEKGKADDCLVVHFRENEKPLIVNVTNSKAIAKVAGSHYIEDWPGTKITLFTMPVSAFGETVEAVRVRQTAPKIKKPILSPDHPKWAGAIENLSLGKVTIDKIRQHYQLSKQNEDALKQAVIEAVASEGEEVI